MTQYRGKLTKINRKIVSHTTRHTPDGWSHYPTVAGWGYSQPDSTTQFTSATPTSFKQCWYDSKSVLTT